jgi:hypothetical protein
MTIQTSDISTILLYTIVSVVLAIFITEENGVSFLYMLPNILGILLGGILASLAIIFGLLSSKDLGMIRTHFKNNNNKDIYLDFIRNTELDAKIIFSNLFISIIIMLIHNIEVVTIDVSIQMKFYFAVGLFILFLSMSSVYDIITSLFHLNELRYELSPKSGE